MEWSDAATRFNTAPNATRAVMNYKLLLLHAGGGYSRGVALLLLHVLWSWSRHGSSLRSKGDLCVREALELWVVWDGEEQKSGD